DFYILGHEPFRKLRNQHANTYLIGYDRLKPSQLARQDGADELSYGLTGLHLVKAHRRLNLLQEAFAQRGTHPGKIECVREEKLTRRLLILQTKLLLHHGHHRLQTDRNGTSCLEPFSTDNKRLCALRPQFQYDGRLG